MVTLYIIRYIHVFIHLTATACCSVAAKLVARLSVSQLDSYFEYLDVMIQNPYACSMKVKRFDCADSLTLVTTHCLV